MDFCAFCALLWQAPHVISVADIREARRVIANTAIRTPLIRLNVPGAPAEIYLKLENLQPIGSFKLRGAASAIARLTPAELERGVVTASAGNMAQGVAWCARRLGIRSEERRVGKECRSRGSRE